MKTYSKYDLEFMDSWAKITKNIIFYSTHVRRVGGPIPSCVCYLGSFYSNNFYSISSVGLCKLLSS
jgi:hypothetical protein